MSDIVPWSSNHAERLEEYDRPGCLVPSLFQKLADPFGARNAEKRVEAAIQAVNSEHELFEAQVRLAKNRLRARQELAELMTAAERSEAAYQLAHTVLGVDPEIGQSLLDEATAMEQRWLEWEAVRTRVNRKEFQPPAPAQLPEPEIEPLLDDETVEAGAAQLAERAKSLTSYIPSPVQKGAWDPLAGRVGPNNGQLIAERALGLVDRGEAEDGISSDFTSSRPDFDEADLDFDDW